MLESPEWALVREVLKERSEQLLRQLVSLAPTPDLPYQLGLLQGQYQTLQWLMSLPDDRVRLLERQLWAVRREVGAEGV